MTEKDPRHISIQEYDYHLPEQRIAVHPLAERDASRLLIYRNGTITESHYRQLHEYIPANTMMIFNNSKVIPARILFTKATGGVIEIFCLEPHQLQQDYAVVMSQTGSTNWKCMVGGIAKWKTPFIEKKILIHQTEVIVKASIIEKGTEHHVVQFEWSPAQYSFAEILTAAGNMPLPPYIKRDATDEDGERYQTVYAREKGSVAAPTAGLHFTPELLSKLSEKGIAQKEVCLHVGAGTFKPVKADKMEAHEMHAEWIDISIDTIRNIRDHEGPVIAVGTTSLRTIESIYWLGVKTMINPHAEIFSLQQWDVYDENLHQLAGSKEEVLSALIDRMQRKCIHRLFTQTQLLIAPGYHFKIADGLVTNFHQPKSTLLLLVAAGIGEQWKTCYDYALENDFRFLSYGDGSLLYFDQERLSVTAVS